MARIMFSNEIHEELEKEIWQLLMTYGVAHIIKPEELIDAHGKWRGDYKFAALMGETWQMLVARYHELYTQELQRRERIIKEIEAELSERFKKRGLFDCDRTIPGDRINF